MRKNSHENLTPLQAAWLASSLSRNEIAQQLGMRRESIDNLLRGTKKPSLPTAQRLARILGTSTDALFPLVEQINEN